MKKLLISTLAVLALCALPGLSQAKDRGCGYRLQSLEDARIALRRAIRHDGNVRLAEAQLSRAKSKAAEEGCFAPRFVSKRVVERRYFYDRHDHRGRHHYDRWHDRRRFDSLIKIKVVRPLSWAERRELDRLCHRWGWKY